MRQADGNTAVEQPDIRCNDGSMQRLVARRTIGGSTVLEPTTPWDEQEQAMRPPAARVQSTAAAASATAVDVTAGIENGINGEPPQIYHF